MPPLRVGAVRGNEASKQRAHRRRLRRSDDRGRREHRDELHRRRQWSDQVDPLDSDQLAHLLEAQARIAQDDGWFGLLRSLSNSVAQTSIYPQWIHNHRYHNLGGW